MITPTKADVEQAGLGWPVGMGWSVGSGPNVASYSRSAKLRLSSYRRWAGNELA